MTVLRKIALPLLKNVSFGRMGLKKKLFRAAFSADTLFLILNALPLEKQMLLPCFVPRATAFTFHAKAKVG